MPLSMSYAKYMFNKTPERFKLNWQKAGHSTSYISERQSEQWSDEKKQEYDEKYSPILVNRLDISQTQGEENKKEKGIESCVCCFKPFGNKQIVNQLPCGCYIHNRCIKHLWCVKAKIGKTQLGSGHIDIIKRARAVYCPECDVDLIKIKHREFLEGIVWKKKYLKEYSKAILQLQRKDIYEDIADYIVNYI